MGEIATYSNWFGFQANAKNALEINVAVVVQNVQEDSASHVDARLILCQSRSNPPYEAVVQPTVCLFFWGEVVIQLVVEVVIQLFN